MFIWILLWLESAVGCVLFASCLRPGFVFTPSPRAISDLARGESLLRRFRARDEEGAFPFAVERRGHWSYQETPRAAPLGVSRFPPFPQGFSTVHTPAEKSPFRESALGVREGPWLSPSDP